MSDAAVLRHLDQLDLLAEQLAHTPFGRSRLRLPLSDWQFLTDILAQDTDVHPDILFTLTSSAVAFSDHVNLPLDKFNTLLYLVHRSLHSVSLDEAIQRG